jgi:hypothetical protein
MHGEEEYAEAASVLREAMYVGRRSLADEKARAQEGRWPDFLVIGAQKAGTTWLYRNLGYHPECWLPPIKELNYFNEVYFPSESGWEREGRLTQASEARAYYEAHPPQDAVARQRVEALEIVDQEKIDDAWYARIFGYAGDDLVCGEVCPEYALLPRAAISRIYARNPALKAIMILRDPIARAWSHVRMNVAREGLKAEELLTSIAWPVIQGHSNYAATIRRWHGSSPPGSLLLLDYDSIASDPMFLLRKACEHISIRFDSRFFPEATHVVREGAELDGDIPPKALEIMRSSMEPIYRELQDVAPFFAAPWISRHYAQPLERPLRGAR